MKCRACWAEKAYVREVKGWKRAVLPCLLVVPLKCHHCYHKFSVPWWSTLGKQLKPPSRRANPEADVIQILPLRDQPPQQAPLRNVEKQAA